MIKKKRRIFFKKKNLRMSLLGLTFGFFFFLLPSFILFLLLFIYSNVFMSGPHEFSFQSDYCICVVIMICNNDGNCLGN